MQNSLKMDAVDPIFIAVNKDLERLYLNLNANSICIQT